MSEITLLVRETSDRHGRFEARLADGEIIIRASTQPFFDAARVLVARGFNSEAVLQMVRENGTESLRALLGEAAKLTVEEGGRISPRFRRWKPFDPSLRGAEPGNGPSSSA